MHPWYDDDEYDAEPVEYEPDDYDEWHAEAVADAAFYGQQEY